MVSEGICMRLEIALAMSCLLVSATALAAPQTSAPRDPPVIDAPGYQKLLEQYRGKPLLVTFWATWCEPCRDEFPMLNELIKEYQPKGLHVVGVDLDEEGDLILMRRFIARYKPVFPNYRKRQGDESQFIQVVRPGWNGAIPASFFYDKEGHQIRQLLGANGRDTYEAAIRTLLGMNTTTGGAPQAK
jgi:cytochrome c biogenesis protein CcmG, thiol:disulfide interchange protein DsbE